MFVLQLKARLAGEDAFRRGWYQLSLKQRYISGSKVSAPPHVSLWPDLHGFKTHLITFAFWAQEHRCCIRVVFLAVVISHVRLSVGVRSCQDVISLPPPSTLHCKRKKKKQPGENGDFIIQPNDKFYTNSFVCKFFLLPQYLLDFLFCLNIILCLFLK